MGTGTRHGVTVPGSLFPVPEQLLDRAVISYARAKRDTRERLAAVLAEAQVDQVQARSLAIDPDVYMDLARERGGRGPALGMRRMLRLLRAARPGLVIGNFARARAERAPRVVP